MKKDLTRYNFIATITLLPTELGGRKNAVTTGYRPSFTFNTSNHYSGEIILLADSELKPGDSAQAQVRLLPARTIRKTLKPNDTFGITEGSRAVGSGIIEKVDILS